MSSLLQTCLWPTLRPEKRRQTQGLLSGAVTDRGVDRNAAVRQHTVSCDVTGSECWEVGEGMAWCCGMSMLWFHNKASMFLCDRNSALSEYFTVTVINVIVGCRNAGMSPCRNAAMNDGHESSKARDAITGNRGIVTTEPCAVMTRDALWRHDRGTQRRCNVTRQHGMSRDTSAFSVSSETPYTCPNALWVFCNAILQHLETCVLQCIVGLPECACKLVHKLDTKRRMCVMCVLFFFVATTNQSQIDTSRISAPSAGNPRTWSQKNYWSLFGFFCLFFFRVFFFLLVLHISEARQCSYARTRPVLSCVTKNKKEQFE